MYSVYHILCIINTAISIQCRGGLEAHGGEVDPPKHPPASMINCQKNQNQQRENNMQSCKKIKSVLVL